MAQFDPAWTISNTGAPQGCVLSALLFIFYANDCRSTDENVKIYKYADDTVILGLLNGTNDIYFENIQSFSDWCNTNYLMLNPTKSKEIIFDFRTFHPPMEPLVLNDRVIEIVDEQV